MSDPKPPSRAAFVSETCDDAVAPYRALVPPEVLAEMRAFLEDALETHPVAAVLVDRARPRAVPDQSGDVAKEEGERAEPQAVRGKR